MTCWLKSKLRSSAAHRALSHLSTLIPTPSVARPNYSWFSAHSCCLLRLRCPPSSFAELLLLLQHSLWHCSGCLSPFVCTTISNWSINFLSLSWWKGNCSALSPATIQKEGEGVKSFPYQALVSARRQACDESPARWAFSPGTLNPKTSGKDKGDLVVWGRWEQCPEQAVPAVTWLLCPFSYFLAFCSALGSYMFPGQ